MGLARDLQRTCLGVITEVDINVFLLNAKTQSRKVFSASLRLNNLPLTVLELTIITNLRNLSPLIIILIGLRLRRLVIIVS